MGGAPLPLELRFVEFLRKYNCTQKCVENRPFLIISSVGAFPVGLIMMSMFILISGQKRCLMWINLY